MPLTVPILVLRAIKEGVEPDMAKPFLEYNWPLPGQLRNLQTLDIR